MPLISVNHIVDRIATETEAVIDEVMPLPRRDVHMETSDSTVPIVWETSVPNDVAGYIRFVDLKQLLALATSHHVQVQVVRRVGQFVPARTPLLRVNKADRLSFELASAFRTAFDFGPTRTLQQDIEFGVLQIVDIALKAISPAVNDPTTAVGCVDQLSRILIRFVSREVPEPRLYDLRGVARVHIHWIEFEKLLESAFGQIRMYSKSDVAVSLRLLRALGDIAITSHDECYRKILFEHGRRVVEGCSEQMAAEDLGNLNARLSELERLATAEKIPATECFGHQRSICRNIIVTKGIDPSGSRIIEIRLVGKSSESAWLNSRQFVELTVQLPRSIPAKQWTIPWKISSHFPLPCSG